MILRRRRRGPTLTVDAARALLPQWLPHAGHLDLDQRERLLDDTVTIADGFSWEAANGVELTDAMRTAVAGHAALLSLELPEGIEAWDHVTSIIVHAQQMVRSGNRPSQISGLYTDEETTIIGEAHGVGPVLVSWSAVRRQVLFHQRSGNVLLHEFAHQLDHRDGSMDGTPLFDDPASRRRWIDVCTAIWQRMQVESHPVLDRYGATNPAEFYAVAVETFFVRAAALAEHEPELFDLLVEHLGQDPRPLSPPTATSSG